MEYARNIIFLLFVHERKGYKRHADCNVISAYVFAICKVHGLYFLNPKHAAFNRLLGLHSQVWVGLSWYPQRLALL